MKAYFLMELAEGGIVMAENDSDLLPTKAPCLVELTELGIVVEWSNLHPLKAPFPIELTKLRLLIDQKALHDSYLDMKGRLAYLAVLDAV
eukprot:8551367-Ditylum_brightwellii.AAC.1